MLDELWQVQLPYATFGIIVERNKVIEAAPIGRWMIGRSFMSIGNWVGQKGGKLIPIR